MNKYVVICEATAPNGQRVKYRKFIKAKDPDGAMSKANKEIDRLNKTIVEKIGIPEDEIEKTIKPRITAVVDFRNLKAVPLDDDDT